MVNENELFQVKNELPSTFKAYRYQQHRWSCGPANLFKKMVVEIMRNKAWFECSLDMLLSFVGLSLCISPLAFYVPAESLPVEKALPDLQLLLCSEDRRPYCHVCILLCCFASYGLGS